MFGKTKDEDRVTDPNFEKTTTAAYPGFIPQRYIRPTMPGKPDPIGDPSQVKNNTDRGTESHGLYVDSQVHPQDDPYLDYEKDHDAKREILPEPEEDCPLPVRVVETPQRRRIIAQVAQYASLSAAGERPFRILAQDRDRIRTRVSLSSAGATVLVVPGLAQNEETQAAYAYSLIGYNNAPDFETVTTEELWVIPPATAGTAYTISVFTERELPIDLPKK